MDETVKQQIELYNELVAEATEQIKPTLIEMKRIAVEIFGESYVQIQPDDIIDQDRQFTTTVQDNWNRDFVRRRINGNAIYRLIIHFPRLTITNDEDDSNEILNLFVGLGINSQGRIVDFRGIRPTFTRDEYDSTYTHSHISGVATKWVNGAFCTGSGPINQSLIILRDDPFDEIEFRLLCYHIKSLVVYESLEGTPYRYIRDIGETGNKDLTRMLDIGGALVENLMKKSLDDIKTQYTDSYLKSLLHFHVTKDGIKVRPTDELEVILGTLLLEYINAKLFGMVDAHVLYLLSIKKHISSYYRLPSEEFIKEQPKPELVITFKGVDYQLNIIESSDTKPKIYAHPDFTTKFCEHLSNNLTQAGYKFNAVYK